MGTYTILDLVPKGRDEDHLGFSMEWVRYHDRYGTTSSPMPTSPIGRRRHLQQAAHATRRKDTRKTLQAGHS